MRRSSWLLLACAALFHLALLVGWRFQAPLIPYFFDATVLSGGRGLDFYSMYQAGYNARHGQDIYEGDPARVTIVVPYFTPYRYLPPDAYTVGAALSLLPPLRAYELWVVVIELTLLGCAGLTFHAARATPNLAARLAAMWLVFTPYYLELFMGQFSLIQAALILGMLLIASKSHSAPPFPNREGGPGGLGRLFDALWIASLIWKINTFVFGPVFLRLGRWWGLAAAGLLSALVTLPYFVAFPAHWRDFVLNNFGGAVSGHELGNLGFRQLVYELLAEVGASADLQRLVQWGVVAVIVLIALALTFKPRPPALAPILSLWLVVFFLISPQVWEHHYVMLLPVLVLAYWRWPSWLIVGLWLLLALPTPFGFTALQPAIAANHDLRAFLLAPAWQFLLQHASKALPTLVLFAFLAVKIARDSAGAGGIIAEACTLKATP